MHFGIIRTAFLPHVTQLNIAANQTIMMTKTMKETFSAVNKVSNAVTILTGIGMKTVHVTLDMNAVRMTHLVKMSFAN